MGTLEDKARAAKEHLDTVATNPATRAAAPASERKRTPMTLPQQRLAAPDIPGYHTHWMLGKPERIQQALAAGYEFVHHSDTQLNTRAVGGDGLKEGNTDLGDRVSTLAAPIGGGEEDEKGQPARLYLMKQKLEWYEEDQKILQARNDGVVDALTAGFQQGTVGGQAQGETKEDMAKRYAGHGGRRPELPELFRRKIGGKR